SVCEMPSGDGKLLSFDDKYRSGGGAKKGIGGGMSKSGMASLNRQIPAPIGDELTARAQELSLGAFRAIGCEGIARVDCLLAADGTTLYVNEINTLPGSLSFYL